MTRPLALLAVLACAALAAGAGPGKPPEVPFCDGSAPGLCNPADVPALDPIPPDAPPVVKLRHQLAKERREHRAEVRTLRARIADLEGNG